MFVSQGDLSHKMSRKPVRKEPLYGHFRSTNTIRIFWNPAAGAEPGKGMFSRKALSTSTVTFRRRRPIPRHGTTIRLTIPRC